jgi:hypothetical protein
MKANNETSQKLPVVIGRLFVDMGILFVAVQSIVAGVNYLAHHLPRHKVA